MKIRWKILLGIVIVLPVLISVWLMTLHIHPESEVEAYKKLLRERGEKLEIDEVLPPAVAPESNSAADVESAFRMLGSSGIKIPDAMKMIAPGKAMIGWRQPEAVSDDFTNSWDDFTTEMAANRPALELLHQVLDRPKLAFQLDYDKGMAIFPRLMSMLPAYKREAQTLDAATICDLHNGDIGAATTNILIQLELARKNESDGLLISCLVRIAMTSIAITPTWELLQATNVTDTQLASVQKEWEQMDFLGDAKGVFQLERAWGIDLIEKMRTSHKDFEKLTSSPLIASSSSSAPVSIWDWEATTEKPRYLVGEMMWCSSWSFADELQQLQTDQIILGTLRTMQTNESQFYKADYDVMNTRLAASSISRGGGAFFRALKIPDFDEYFSDSGLGACLSKIIRIDAARRVVVTAIALKRFQLQYGKLPGTLTELAPKFIPSVPIDPYDGKPLRYRPNPDGTYLLYCIGEDGKDDGGDPAITTGTAGSSLYWQGNHARDWVWPQPATTAEIQKYYDDQTKKSE